MTHAEQNAFRLPDELMRAFDSTWSWKGFASAFGRLPEKIERPEANVKTDYSSEGTVIHLSSYCRPFLLDLSEDTSTEALTFQGLRNCLSSAPGEGEGEGGREREAETLSNPPSVGLEFHFRPLPRLPVVPEP
jgi:hypothetical protein